MAVIRLLVMYWQNRRKASYRGTRGA